MFAPINTSPTEQAAARAIQALPGLIARVDDLKARYKALQATVEASRAQGIEAPGDVVRALQGLYDAHRALSRSTTEARTAIIPHIRLANQRGALTDADLETLAAAKILPRVNGKGVIPPGFLQGLNGAIGLGILPLIPIAIALAIVAAGATIPLTVYLGHVRQAKADEANAILATQAADTALSAWQDQAKADLAAAVEARKADPSIPLPTLPPLPGLPEIKAGASAAASGAILSGPVKTIAIAAAAIGALYLLTRKRRS